MILFVVDQIAGAEYVLPLIGGPLRSADWSIIASPVSSSLLSREGVPHQVVEEPTFQDAESWIRTIGPTKALVSASVRSKLEKSFVQALRMSEIPCFQFIDMWINYRRRFESLDDPLLMVYPDSILTLDSRARSQMESEGIPASLIQVVGQPALEVLLKKYSPDEAGKMTRGEKILIATQPVHKYYGKSLGYDESDFIQSSLEALQLAAVHWRQIDICVHPAESTETYRGLAKQFSNEIAILHNPILQMDRYRIVLGMFSSLLVHGILSGSSAASVQPGAPAADMCPLPNIPRFHRAKELAEWINNCTTLPRPVPKQEFQILLGSGDRVASLLCQA